MNPFLVTCLALVGLILVRVPVSFAIAIASLAGYAAIPDPFGSMAWHGLLTNYSGGLDKLSLVAIPFFILAGGIMGQGGMAARLIDLSRAMLGGLRGGTSYVSVLSSMFFGGVSGSAVAEVSSLGSILIPAMKKEGYGAPFATAVTVSSSTLGLIIPPSNVMILYAVIAAGTRAEGAHAEVDLDIRTMFLAGFIPGGLIALSLLAACAVLARVKQHPRGEWPGPRAFASALVRATPAIGVVAVILGGILFGFITADESAALAVVCAFIVGLWVYRELRPRDLPRLLLEGVVTTGIVFFLIAASNAMKYVFIHVQFDSALRDFCLGFTTNRFAFLLVLNVVLFAAGLFLDMTPAILIFTPLFLPTAVSYGIHPIHFGIVMMVNLSIGLCTPPVGSCLFVGSSISGVPLAKMVRPLLPFYAAMIGALLVVTYWEPATMTLPSRWLTWFPRVLLGS